MKTSFGIEELKAEIRENWNDAILNDPTMVAVWNAAKSIDLDETYSARFVALTLLRSLQSARERAAPETPSAEDSTRFDRLRATYELLENETDPHEILGTRPGDDR